MSGKLLKRIKSMYVDSLACVRVKGSESEWFKIDSEVRQGYIMSPWLFNVYRDAVMNEVKMGMRRIGVRFLEEAREPGILYADDLVLFSESENSLITMVESFVEVCTKRELKVNGDLDWIVRSL